MIDSSKGSILLEGIKFSSKQQEDVQYLHFNSQ